MGAKRNAYRIFMGKPEGKRPLGRPIRRWVDDINPVNSDLNTLCVNTAHRFTCPTRSVHCIKI
jgi:hypothetical protein